jgi:hypothetical protein
MSSGESALHAGIRMLSQLDELQAGAGRAAGRALPATGEGRACALPSSTVSRSRERSMSLQSCTAMPSFDRCAIDSVIASPPEPPAGSTNA